MIIAFAAILVATSTFHPANGQMSGHLPSRGLHLGDQQPTPTRSVVLRTSAEFRRAARARLLEPLREPESARFRNVRRYAAPNGYIFCGEVNARNGFGGMTGFVRFQAFANADGRGFAEVDNLDHQMGRTYFQAGWDRDCSGTGEPTEF